MCVEHNQGGCRCRFFTLKNDYYSFNYVYFICQLTHRRDTVRRIEQPVLSLKASFLLNSLNMPSTLTKVHGAQNSCSQLLSPQNHLNNCTSRMSYNSLPSSKSSYRVFKPGGKCVPVGHIPL